MSFLGAVGSAAVGGISSVLSAPVGYYYGKKDRRDAADVDWKTYKKQREYDLKYDVGPGFELAKMYDEKDFKLAKRYMEYSALNSPSLAVEGLRRAGLNPILAASQGFNAQADYGHQGAGAFGSGGNIHSVGGNSYKPDSRVDLARAMSDVGALDVQASTATKLRADSNVSQAQADLIKAQTLRQYVDAINEYHSQGGISKAGVGAITRLFGSGDSALDKVMHKAGFDSADTTGSFNRGMSDAVDWISKMFAPTRATTPPASAKDKKRFLSDINSAVKLSNAVSPSPAPLKESVPVRMRHELNPAGKNATMSPKSKRRHN